MWDSVRLSTHFESAWSHLIISTVHSWFRPHKSRVFVHRKRINLKTPATWIMDAWYADKCENRDNATTRVLSVSILMALVHQLWALFRALWLRRRCQCFQNRSRVHVCMDAKNDSESQKRTCRRSFSLENQMNWPDLGFRIETEPCSEVWCSIIGGISVYFIFHRPWKNWFQKKSIMRIIYEYTPNFQALYVTGCLESQEF
jgi:hypothetical protein